MSPGDPTAKRIGAYQVRGTLGVGGMGEVFLAWDERLQRHVAVKQIRHDVRTTAERRRRLRQEARAAAALNHPAIVQVYDILQDDREDATRVDGLAVDSLVMEFVEGRSLADLLAAGEVDASLALRIARQVAEGLAKAHEKGMVHRDLKTENVMVTPEGQAKILDFGLVKNLTREEIDESLTRDGAVLGTVRVMSPEQAGGDEVGPGSDLYSLGVLLYEMLTGQPLFRGTALQIHRQVLTETPPPPRVLRPELPAELGDLIEALLEKEPTRRPRTASEVAETLERMAALPGVAELGPAPVTPLQQLPSDASTVAQPGGLPNPASVPGAVPVPATRAPEVDRSFGPTSWRSQKIPIALATLGLAIASLYLATRQDPTVGAAEVFPTSSPSEDASPSIPTRYRQAWNQLAHYDRPGNVDRAIEGFQRVVASGEMQAAGHAGLARAYWRKYLWLSFDPVWLEQAGEVARRAVALDSDLASSRVSLALVLVEERRFDEALAELDYALLLEPHNGEAFLARARLEVTRDRPAAAHAAFESALDAGLERQEVHHLRGQLYYEEGQYTEALEEFRKSVEKAPDSVLGYRNLSATYFKLGRYGEASTELQKALEIQPTANLYTNLGTLFFYQGLYPQAATAMEKCLEFPGGANLYLHWSNLGDAYRQIPGRENDASEAFRQAVRLLRERHDSGGKFGAKERSRLALFLAKSGDDTAALAELAELEPADRQLPAVLYRIALAHEIGGRREEAVATLERALQSGYPTDEIRRDPEFLELRADVRYHRMLARVEDNVAVESVAESPVPETSEDAGPNPP